jgi:hypothetical protein
MCKGNIPRLNLSISQFVPSYGITQFLPESTKRSHWWGRLSHEGKPSKNLNFGSTLLWGQMLWCEYMLSLSSICLNKRQCGKWFRRRVYLPAEVGEYSRGGEEALRLDIESCSFMCRSYHIALSEPLWSCYHHWYPWFTCRELSRIYAHALAQTLDFLAMAFLAVEPILED